MHNAQYVKRSRLNRKTTLLRRNRAYNYKRYGISNELAYELSDPKNRLKTCPICGVTKLLELDHNHRTDKVRGFLCGSCNRVLGHAKDKITTLLNAVEYLRKHQDS